MGLFLLTFTLDFNSQFTVYTIIYFLQNKQISINFKDVISFVEILSSIV